MKKSTLFIVVLLLPLVLVAQKVQVIRGRVLADDGTTLPGASVYVDKNTIGEASSIAGVVKNFSLGTTTDIDGNFSLELPVGVKQLKCSYMGYTSQTIAIGGRDFITITMQEEKNLLDEVVVTGYQKIEKRKLTSAVSKVSTDKILQAGVSSVDQMLDGQLAGVQTTVVSGAPGAPAKIRIRGTVSLNGTGEPLWVLDGIPLEGTDLPNMDDKDIGELLLSSSIGNINPNDIEDITILKDAAATAIYGSRAANGVIVITTKKGKKGSMNVNLRMNTSFVARPDFDKLNLMNSDQKVDYELMLAGKEKFSYGWGVKKGRVSEILEENSLLDAYKTGGWKALSQKAKDEISALRRHNTDWGNELYRTAVNQEYGLSISGGSDDASYYFSAGYYDEQGATVGVGLDRLNFTLKGDYKLLKNLTVGAAIYSSRTRNESFLVNEGSASSPSRYSRIANPYQRLYDDEGKYVYDNSLFASASLPFNVKEERENTSYNKDYHSLNTIFNVDWEIISKLHFRTQFGLQREDTQREQYGDSNSFFTRRERVKSRDHMGNYFLPEGGIIRNWNSNRNQWTLKNILEYNLRLKEVHEFDFMVGTELRKNDYTSISSKAYGYNKETLNTKPVVLPEADKITYIGELYSKNYIENAFVSWYGTLGYTFDNKYTVFGSFRVDGSNMFGADPKFRYQPLWAISGSWRVNEEEFLKDKEWLNSLKLRASYGLQGNANKSASPYIIGEIQNVKILDKDETIISPQNLPNDRLRWEKTENLNLGFDLGVFNNRFKLSADYYHRKSTDIVGTKTVALENGLSTTSLNWAGLTNEGVEVNITTLNVKTKDFKWTTTFNIAKNTNRVDQLFESDKTRPSRVGRAINSVFVIKTAGLDKDGFLLFYKDGKKVKAEEKFKLVNTGWEYVSEMTDKEKGELYTCAGTDEPEFSGGLINSFSYKNFSLDVSCSFNLGMWKREQPFYKIVDVEMTPGVNHSTRMSEVWSETNRTGTYPRMIEIFNPVAGHEADISMYRKDFVMNHFYQDLDIWYKKMNIFRVNSIRFGYKLPESLLTKVSIASAKLSLEVRNPFVFGTDYDGYFDPETYGNIYAQPIPRSITAGITVNF